MKLTRLNADAAARLAVKTLGIDPDTLGLTSSEGLAASLRRAASFMCPTSPSRLVDAVLEALNPFNGGILVRDDVVELLDQLVGSGDLLELKHESGRSTRLLYLGPPSFIERVPGTFLLMGIRPFGAPLISDELSGSIEYERHTRVISLDPAGAVDELRAYGLQPIAKRRWVASPSVESPTDLIERHRSRLNVAPVAGELDGLQLLDPTAKVNYYRGRWRAPSASDTGDFVVRRPQAYGADLWCLVRFDAGLPKLLLEFPVADPVTPSRDEAWRYQAAVDADRGKPQEFRIRRGASPSGDVVFDFFSPLPGFAERYVQFAGIAVTKTSGALFSFRVPAKAVDDLITFLTEMLWMNYLEADSD